MRIAIAGFNHETNTFCTDRTDTRNFSQIRGERLFQSQGTQTSLGGALDTCAALGIEAVPLLAVQAQPSGIIEFDTYQAFTTEILDGIRNNLPLDGVFLDLHGAGVVDGIGDLETNLTKVIRDLVGEAVPIAATFDLHGNINQAMCDALDGTFACHQYPHIDLHLRAREAIELIVRMHKENFRPVTHVEYLPLLLPTTTTFEGIGQAQLKNMLAAEAESGVIDVSWFHGFPYADTKDVGASIAVTTSGDREQAERTAKRLAQGLWQAREAFRPLSLSGDEAVARAVAAAALNPDKPVVINETSDNCGGGTPGDGTHLLRSMLDAKLEQACFGFIVDPEVADQAHEAGVGATISVDLGGKTDALHGEPLHLTVYVKALHDGRLKMRAMFKGAPLHLGKFARLVINDIDIIVGSRRSQTFDIAPFLAVGIDVSEYPIVALKSSNHFRAGFTHIASSIITADTPGLTTHKLQVFGHKNLRAPSWPLDSSASYPSN